MFALNNKKITQDDSDEQLNFLEQELIKINQNNEKCFIMMHNPPFPELYNDTSQFFYHEIYAKRLEEIVIKKINLIYLIINY